MPEPESRSLPQGADLALLSRLVMRRQAALSVRVALAFLVLILGLPLVNRYAPDLASYPIFGMPASWLFLGVVFYPITVALSVYFVKRSDRIEEQSKGWQAAGEGGPR